MERTEDFCFKSKYLRSNMNQLRKKKQELNVQMSCPIILHTKNKPKGKDSSGLDYVVHILTKSLDTWLRS